MNFTQAKCQLFKGTLFVAGIGMGLGALYTISNVYQKGKALYVEKQTQTQFENYLQTDSRFANGLTITQFCVEMHQKYQPREDTK